MRLTSPPFLMTLAMVLTLIAPATASAQIWPCCEDEGRDVVVDASGNIYAVGWGRSDWGPPLEPHNGLGNPNASVSKLNSSGVLLWNTFIGEFGLYSTYEASGVALDASGNVYVAGWDSNNGGDAFVAKLTSSGSELWRVSFGSGNDDAGRSIALDASGNIYVSGYSYGSWGSPVNAHPGGGSPAIFAAKLNSSGVVQWNTFFGSTNWDVSYGVDVDASGNVYLVGESAPNPGGTGWGTPIRAHSGGSYDAFVAKLNSSGALQWNTFLGSSDFDSGHAIELDGSGNVHVVGRSTTTWGTPVSPYSGNAEAFVAKLNNSGALQWHNFLGSASYDRGDGLTLDASANVFVVGRSYDTWGSPVNAHALASDAFAAKLNSSGVLQWNTFMGAAADTVHGDWSRSVALDGSGSVFVIGESDTPWGTPVHPYAGDDDMFVAKLNGSGVRQWHSFLGSGNEVTTDSASDVTAVSATLNGTLESMGTAPSVEVQFQWGLTSSYGDESLHTTVTSTGPFAIAISGLSPNTTYHYRARAEGFVDQVGEDRTFTTGPVPVPPAVTTDAAGNVFSTSATLNGTLDGLGTAALVNVSFEWGPTTSYGNETVAELRTSPGQFDELLLGLSVGTTYHYRAKAVGDGTTYGVDQSFTTSVPTVPPSVTTNSASGVTTSTVTLNGNLDALGTASPVDVSFEWGLTTSYGSETTSQSRTGTGAYSDPLVGLMPGTTYHYRAKASGDGVSFGDDATFTTAPLVMPPSVNTDPATNVTLDSATLNGTLASLGDALSVDVTFEWGTTVSYGNETSVQSRSGTGSFSDGLTGLSAGTTYHYRAKAVGEGTDFGADRTFTTATEPPTVTTDPASSVGVSSAVLNGSLNDLGTASSVDVSFVWGLTTSYGNETTSQARTGTGAFNDSLSGLSPGTTYHFRAKAVGEGTGFGIDRTFTTQTAPPAVATDAATAIGDASATLNGTLSDLGSASPVSVSFEWGTTTSYGSETTPQATTAIGAFSAPLSGLSASTTYHFRAKAVGDGTAYGIDQMFMTAAPDADADGVPDSTDNCTTVWNPSQNDTDMDQFGNACDPDFNNDCVVDSIDSDLFQQAFIGGMNPPLYDLTEPPDGSVGVPDFLVVQTYLGLPPGPNWSGVCPSPTPQVPLLDARGIAVLTVLLAAFGFAMLRSRREIGTG